MQKLLLLLILSLAPTVGFAEPLRVFASVVPIQTFVEKIGGQHVDARAMVRPGFNPHTYDPTPQQISALAGAAINAVGTPDQLERFLTRFTEGEPKWGAMAMTEPQAGSDTSNIQTTAVFDEESNEWVLNGREVDDHHPLSFKKADRDLCFNRIRPEWRMPDTENPPPTGRAGGPLPATRSGNSMFWLTRRSRG